MYLISQDRSNFLIKLSLAKALEEVATSISEEAWLNYKYAIYRCLDYVHNNMFFYSVSLPKEFFESLRLPFQRELHILTKPLFLRTRGCSYVRYSYHRVFVSSAEPLDKIGCTRQFESKLSLRSFAQSLPTRGCR